MKKEVLNNKENKEIKLNIKEKDEFIDDKEKEIGIKNIDTDNTKENHLKKKKTKIKL